MSKLFPPQSYPSQPGVYLMKDQQGKIIYVGKANNIRRRLHYYFRPHEQLAPKTQVMVKQIHRIDYLCTNTEKEALLLEASLIKKHTPRYNIVLRDDKDYILFKLDCCSSFPRLILTRKVVHDGSRYFGPFTSAQAARETLKVINRIFPLRKCSDRVFSNRTRPCLQYNMGRCLGPCVYQVSPQDYAQIVKRVEMFLSGRSKELIRELEREMSRASSDLAFEKAAEIRDQIGAVKKTVEQQTVVSPQGGDKDIIGWKEFDKGFALGVLFVRQGKLIGKKNFSMNVYAGPGSFGEEKILSNFLIQFYTPGRYIPDIIVTPINFNDPALNEVLTERKGAPVKLICATGKKDKQLVQLAKKNAIQVAENEKNNSVSILLKQRLNLNRVPYRIESIDASHLHGQGLLVGQTVFEEQRPKKEGYRIYKFPELEGSKDDYAALAGWMRRRLRSGPPWPDLVLIDGGKGQLSAVDRTFEQELQDWENNRRKNSSGQEGKADNPFPDIEFVSMAKGQRRKGELAELLYRPHRKNAIALKPGSPELLFLQDIRDQTHRYVLSRQKKSRKKETLESELEKLPGIGPGTARLLWNHFESIQDMQQAKEQDLLKLPGIGRKKARNIFEALQDLKNIS